jgi:glyoxylase-like metal-dependent hydrolase (beta-lactamase superfamily II)
MRAILLAVGMLAAVQPGGVPRYEVYAVRFAHVPYAESSLVAGAAKGPQVDIAFTIWPIVDASSGRVILVDAGFYRDKFMASWKPQDYVRPSVALQSGLNITPDRVTDIIVTHSHWDHFDGADLFPNATIWIQKAEFDYYLDPAGTVRNRGGLDTEDAPMLAKLNAAGRVRLVDGDNKEVLPGVRVYTGGKHTFESQFVGVTTSEGTLILASDNAYLYKNLDNGLAIAQTLDAASNVAAQKRMVQLAGNANRVIPGHDPAVFTRFTLVTPNVARLTR